MKFRDCGRPLLSINSLKLFIRRFRVDIGVGIIQFSFVGSIFSAVIGRKVQATIPLWVFLLRWPVSARRVGHRGI
jgi:hypothetical protein